MLILLLIGYFFALSIGIYTLIHIIRNHKDYTTVLIAFLNFFAIFITIIIYSSLFVLSIITFYSEDVNLILWKLSLITGLITLGFTSIIYSFLVEYKKIPVFPFLIYMILLGLLIGNLLSPDSIKITMDPSKTSPHLIFNSSTINFIYHPITALLVAVFQLSILLYLYIICFKIYINARDKQILNGFIANTIIFTIPIIMYILYAFFPISIFRELHIFMLWLNYSGVCFMLIKKPEMFLVLTNKVYAINIYHKSGVLLYSYKNKKLNQKFGEEKNDAAIWGNILIGINHILSEFIEKSDQIDVFKTKNADIVVDYNNDYGFAVLVITDLKNDILDIFINSFALEFKDKYEKELIELQDLNKIINVSEFKDTKEMIEKNFQIYL